MILTVHILLKDLRRHWWEIALYLISVFGWAWQKAHPNPWISSNASELFPIAMFIVWFLLVIRVIQGESLTGTREFWSTRPYRAGQLMIAKFLFLVLCLNLPLAIAEYWLLKNAGLAVTPHVFAQIAILQIEFFVILILPAAALAAITDSIVQWVLVILGGLLFTFVMSWLPWNSLTPSLDGTELVANYAGFGLIGILLLALLFWQFHRRRPLPARIVFAIAVILVPLVVAFASTRLARSTAYPDSASAPLQLEIYSLPERQYSRMDYFADSVGIQFPVLGTPAPDTVAVVEGARFHLTASAGWSFQTDWMKENFVFSPNPRTQPFGFTLPSSIADQIPQRNASLEAELAVAVYHLDPAQRIDTRNNQFDVHGLATCNWMNREGVRNAYNSLDCETALRLPDVYTVDLDSGENTCLHVADAPPFPAGHHASGIMVTNDDMPIELDPNPVRTPSPSTIVGTWQPEIYLLSDENHRNPLSGSICQGTPFVLRIGHFVQRIRVTITLGSMGKENRVKTLQESFVPMYPRPR